MNLDGIAFLEVFRFLHARAERHKITAVFGEERSLPLGTSNPHADRYHAPAVSDQPRDCPDFPALLRRHCHEEVGSRSAPVEDLAAKFEVHWYSISARERKTTPHQAGFLQYNQRISSILFSFICSVANTLKICHCEWHQRPRSSLLTARRLPRRLWRLAMTSLQ